MSIGPTVRRRRVGSELRRLREAHSFKLEEAADKLGLAASTLSRIETGKAPTRTAYLATMFEMYGVDDPAQRGVLTEMAREGDRKGWWAVYDDVLPTGFDVYVGLEAELAALRVFEDQVVHGLLQTEDYARTVMNSVRLRKAAARGRSAGPWNCGCKRQRVLTRPDPVKLWCILNEPVITRLIGGPKVMSGQLERLLEASDWPHVTLQVLPLSSGVHPALNGPFCILEFPERERSRRGLLGRRCWSRLSGKRIRGVRACAEVFDLLRAAALSPADTVKFIGRMADGLA